MLQRFHTVGRHCRRCSPAGQRVCCQQKPQPALRLRSPQLAPPRSQPQRHFLGGLFGSSSSSSVSSQPYEVKHTTQRILPFTPEQIYNVILDVNNYHLFLPYCTGSRITQQLSATSFESELTISFYRLKEQYKCIVTHNPGTYEIKVEALPSAMFTFLESTWTLQPMTTPPTSSNNTSSKGNRPRTYVTLNSDVKVTSPLHAATARMFFDSVTKMQIDGFEKRCKAVYSRKAAPAASATRTSTSMPTQQPRSFHSSAATHNSNANQRRPYSASPLAAPLHRSQHTSSRRSASLHTPLRFMPHRTFFGFGGSTAPINHTIRKIINFPPHQLFAVVLDVDQYREYLPFCVHSKVTRTVNDHAFEAEMAIGFKMFTESYVSLVEYDDGSNISVRAIESRLFDHLQSTWSFKPMGTGDDTNGSNQQTMVTFHIDFQVSSPMHAAAVNMFFGEVANRQMSAFMDRCKQVYGEYQPPQNVSKPQRRSRERDGRYALEIEHNMGPSKQSTESVAPVVAAAESTQQQSSPSTQPSSPQIALQAPLMSPDHAAPTSTAASSLPSVSPPSAGWVGHTCQPWWHGRAHFNPNELLRLRHVFVKHAKPSSHTQHSHHSQMQWQEAEEIDATTGAELQLTKEQWRAAASDLLADSSKPHTAGPPPSTFYRYRDRAALIAGFEDPHLADAFFHHDPFRYPVYYKPAADAEYQQATNTDGELTYEDYTAAQNDTPTSVFQPDHEPAHGSHSSGLNTQTQQARTMGFGEFVQQIYFLTKAQYEEKLMYSIMTSAITLINQNSKWGRLLPAGDAQSNRSADVGDVAMPAHLMREFSHQQFHVFLGVIRHVMPSMVYNEAKQQQSLLDDDIEGDSIDQGVQVMAIMGMMDSVIAHTEHEVHATIDKLINAAIADAPTPASSSSTECTDDEYVLSLQDHIRRWRSPAVSDVLSTLSVSGVSSLIQWASALHLNQPTDPMQALQSGRQRV